MRFENQRHDKGKYDRRRYARARRGKRTGERLEQPLLRPFHRAVGKKIAESRNRNGGARPGKIHKRLIQTERRERNARQHEHHEDLARSKFGKIDDHLCDHADESADRKRFDEHIYDFEKFHSM